jgi:hypothetical protein
VVFGTRAVIPNTIKGSRDNWGYFTKVCQRGTPLSDTAPKSPHHASNIADCARIRRPLKNHRKHRAGAISANLIIFRSNIADPTYDHRS